MDFDNNPKIDAINEFISNPKRKLSKINLDALSINGACINEPMSDYLAKKAIQSSNIKECSYSPKDFLESYNSTKNIEQSDAMHLGTFTHSAILEPELFKKFVVKPKLDLRSSDGLRESVRFHNRLTAYSYNLRGINTNWSFSKLKEFNTMLMEETRGIIIEEEYKEKIDKIENSLHDYREGLVPRLLEGALTEVSMYCFEPVTGLEVKIRPDFINIEENVGRNIIGSVKTTSTKSFSEFVSQCIELQYEISEAFYQDIVSHITGRNFDTTVMIVAQTVEPFHVYVVVWEDSVIEYGRYRYMHNLDIIKECFDNNYFPAIEAKAPIGNGGIFQLSYPDGVLARQEEYISLEK